MPPPLPIGELPAHVEAFDQHYEPIPNHFKTPHGIFIHEGTGIAVDGADNVYVFNRGNCPVVVYDRDGNCLGGWGNQTPFSGTTGTIDPYGNPYMCWKGSEYFRPHAVHVDFEGNVWLVDDLGNTVTKCNGQGKRLMVLHAGGVITGQEAADLAKHHPKGEMPPAPAHSCAPFNRPTDVCVHPDTGEFFVSDGYGNSCVHRFASDGRHIQSWGRPGTDPGEFNLPHSIVLHPDHDKVMVADRENSRVQIFTLDGTFVDTWPAHRAVAVAVGKGPNGEKSAIFVAEQGACSLVQRGAGNQDQDSWTARIGHRICVLDNEGNRLSVIGASHPGERPGQFNWLHSMAIDSHGDLYAAEVCFVECGRIAAPHARELVSIRKWRRRYIATPEQPFCTPVIEDKNGRKRPRRTL